MSKNNYKSNNRNSRNTKRGNSSKSSTTCNTRNVVSGDKRDGSNRTSGPESSNDEGFRQSYPYRKGQNDIGTWSKNADTLKNAANISYASPLGLKLGYDKYGVSTKAYANDIPNNAIRMPGIMVFDVDLTPGLATDNLSPINIASQALYTTIRKRNNKNNLSYDRADVIIAVTALSNFYAMWNYGARAYRSLSGFSPFNRYKPENLISAMGFDYNDLSQNAADFRFKLNQMAQIASKLPIPGTFPLFVRQSWMMSSIFKDSESEKAQMYLFRPRSYYVYQAKTSSQGGMLEYNRITHDKLTVEDIISILQEQLTAILDDTDIGNIEADIAFAFGSDTMHITTISEDEQVIPVYNREVLSQIENMTIIPQFSSPTPELLQTWNITQNVDTLQVVFKPYIAQAATLGAGPIYWGSLAVNTWPSLLNSRFDNPTPADNMIATRLITKLKLEHTTTYDAYISDMCTEVVRDARVYTITDSGNSTITVGTRINNAIPLGNTGVTNQSLLGYIRSRMLLSNFDWYPTEYGYSYNVDTTTFTWDNLTENIQLDGIVKEVDNYTILDPLTLRNMNLLAVENVWGLDF